MAFSYVVLQSRIPLAAGKWLNWGSFNSAGVTSGSVVTGLSGIEASWLENKTTAGAGLIDDTTTAGTLALSGLTSNDVGYWFAIGTGA